LYNCLPSNIKEVISNYGPEKLNSLINPHLPYLDNFLYGGSYAPYAIASYLIASSAMGIKKEDINWKKLEEIYKTRIFRFNINHTTYRRRSIQMDAFISRKIDWWRYGRDDWIRAIFYNLCCKPSLQV
jgi:hypothetical protein